MKTKRFLLMMMIFVLFGGLLSIEMAKASVLLPAHRALVTFRDPLTRRDLEALLQEYRLTPTAIYMVNAGLVGVHRTYEPRDIDGFFTIAQQRTMEAMQKGLQANTIRLKRFLEQHNEEEVLAREHLQQELRSLLNIRLQIEATLKAAQGDLPIIYAAEVTGENLAKLQSDRRIASFQEFNLLEMFLLRRPRPVPATAFQREFIAPELQSMGPRELYKYAESIVYP